MNGNVVKAVLWGLITALVLGSYGWATYATNRVEDKTILRLDRIEEKIDSKFKELYEFLERRGEK